MNKKQYSVTQVNKYIKGLIEEDFFLSNISVVGEVSNCKYHSAGHIYFSLKDSTGLLSCIMFASKRNGLKFQMEDGQKVVVSGRISTYEKSGTYQLYANTIDLDGESELFAKFQKMKNELEEEGMFSSIYKKAIPKYVKIVGIVTASTGAAIQDIVNIAHRRNPFVKLVLSPCLVQGNSAKESIVDALHKLEKINPDVIIIGRGGGSIEDLWAFNERCVAEAIFNCRIPIISAVGHETDFTISDFVSDLRAPTPSSGAELAVFSYEEFLKDVNNYKKHLNICFERLFNQKNEKIKKHEITIKKIFEQSLNQRKQYYLKVISKVQRYSSETLLIKAKHEIIDKQDRINLFIQDMIDEINEKNEVSKNKINELFYNQITDCNLKYDNYIKEIDTNLDNKINDIKNSFKIYIEKVNNISPTSKMLAGYSFVSNKKGDAIKSINNVKIGDEVKINISDGVIESIVKSKYTSN